MVRHNVLFTLPFFCLTTSVTAFSVGKSPVLSSITSHHTTRLYAEEEDKSEHPGDHTLPSESTSDILNSPAFLKRKIDVLKSDINKVESELEKVKNEAEAGRAEWGQQLDDLQMEYKQIQERLSMQNTDADGAATVQVARKMLAVLDNYDRAFGVVTAETESEKEIEAAYKATYAKIMETFEKLGIKEVETVGKEFDYEVHQAVMQRPSDYEEGIVCEELQKGFVFGDKLIRAAMVSVSA